MDRFPDDDEPEQPQAQPSWIQTILIPKLQEKAGVLQGTARAPYIEEEGFEPAEIRYTLDLTVIDPRDSRYRDGHRYSINGDAAISHRFAREGDKEQFEVKIDKNGHVNIGNYTTNEPGCIGQRINYVLYAAADLWHLLPEGAKI